MAIDKAVDSGALNGLFTDIATAIRGKTGGSTTYTPSEMATAIAALPAGLDAGMLALIKGNASGDIVATLPDDPCAMGIAMGSEYGKNPDVTGLDLTFSGSWGNWYRPSGGLEFKTNVPKLKTLILRSTTGGKVTITRYDEGSQALRTIDELEHVEIRNINSIATLGYPLFKDAPKLATALLDLVDSVGDQWFKNCPLLHTVDLGGLRTTKGTIYGNAFNGCSALTALIIRTDDAWELSNTNALSGTPIASKSGYVYVPSALISAYKNSTNWVMSSAQFRALEDYTVDGTTSGALDPTKI